MVRRTRQQGVPVIAIDDQYIVGFDQPRIEQALAASQGSWPRFGAAIADAASITSSKPGLPSSGAYVGRVNPGSPAANAGLAAGDVIVEIDGAPVSNAAGVETALGRIRQESSVSLVFVRAGERRSATTTLN
jgi:S1-C subfamily serine protease